MTEKPIYRRVAIFQTLEIHVAASGEWFRDNARSQKSLTQLINEFIETKKVEVIYVSAPAITLSYASTEERGYFVSASVIYVPGGIVRDSYQEPEIYEQQINQEEVLKIPLPTTPEEIHSILGEALARAPGFRQRPESVTRGASSAGKEARVSDIHQTVRGD